MPRATWNGATLAETGSDAVHVVAGAVYFPPDCVDHTYLRESRTRTVCPVKGVASFYDVVVDDEVNRDAAWLYAAPKPGAEEIAGYVAFRNGVEIEQDA
jgi:uncharacterized protein (DUF427 family)